MTYTTSHKKNHINFKIVGYKPDYKTIYKDLNCEWLKKYFEIEPADEKILSDPEKEVIEKNGFIFFALFEDEVIGTCTLIRHNDTTFELSKMCVTENYQRKGVGEKLVDEAISKAYESGIKKIFLCTNKKLAAAINLYRKKGFKIIYDPLVSNSIYKCGYARESIYMCYNLNYKNYEKDKI